MDRALVAKDDTEYSGDADQFEVACWKSDVSTCWRLDVPVSGLSRLGFVFTIYDSRFTTTGFYRRSAVNVCFQARSCKSEALSQVVIIHLTTVYFHSIRNPQSEIRDSKFRFALSSLLFALRSLVRNSQFEFRTAHCSVCPAPRHVVDPRQVVEICS